MFCTNCGKRIPASTVRCPSCGQEQDRLEGGNGFWDMVDGPRLNQTPEPPPEPQKTNRKWPVLLSVFCMLLCVVCIVSVLILKMSVDNIITEIDSMNSVFTVQEALVGELESVVDEQGAEIASIQSTIEDLEAEVLIVDASEEMPEEASNEIPEALQENVPSDVPEEDPNTVPDVFLEETTNEW